MNMLEKYDAIVVGGGPAGATAAYELALSGRSVLLLDRAGRIKPCGGAVPPRLIRDFDIPETLLVARARCARMISPKNKNVDIPIEGGFVGMVDREVFDDWLRQRAVYAGAQLRLGRFTHIDRCEQGITHIHWQTFTDQKQEENYVATAKVVIGADGAKSKVALSEIPKAGQIPYVFAYHEIVSKPKNVHDDYDPQRCDVVYQGILSPDFYAWVFPHGETVSIGTGSADKGFSLRSAVTDLRERIGFAQAETVRREGAPIPLKPLSKWDNGRDVLLAGDAAGVVAPASGEGIYYAMLTGRLAAQAAEAFLISGNPKKLALARKHFMAAHGRVFWILRIMQFFWYRNDARRENFVDICRDKDVQKLTFDAYMNKELVKAKPMAHIRIFFKDLAYLLGFVRT
jgi:geranylgeranyl diphosphate/geranylgeranyl-bacteriochlorophyllide a reductase